MPLLRLILLLGLTAGTLLLARSNWQPMQLIFLGVQSPSLPLAVWLLAAVLAGVATTLVLGALLQLTGLVAERTERKRFRAQPSQRPPSSYGYAPPPSSANPVARPNWQPTPPPPTTRTAGEEDDWDQDPEDWFEDGPDDRSRTTYSNQADPRASDRSNMPPRDSRFAAPRQPDPVVDADYRVIVPPQRNLEDEP
jgi:uncharacterized integral membrane protein